MNAPVVVVTNVVFDHIDQFFLAGKSLAVVPFPFQDTPEAFHRPIVDALGHAGHALRHTGLFQLVMKRAAGILKASVTMEKRVRAGIGFYGPIKGLKNQRIVIAVTDRIGDDTTIIKIQNSAEIDLVYFNAFIPLEFRYICEPLFVWPVRIEFTVKKILGYILRVLCPPGTAVVVVLDGGLDVSGATDSENAFVAHMDVLIVSEIIIDAAVALFWTFQVDPFDLLCNLFILQCPGAPLTGCPTVVGCS